MRAWRSSDDVSFIALFAGSRSRSEETSEFGGSSESVHGSPGGISGPPRGDERGRNCISWMASASDTFSLAPLMAPSGAACSPLRIRNLAAPRNRNPSGETMVERHTEPSAKGTSNGSPTGGFLDSQNARLLNAEALPTSVSRRPRGLQGWMNAGFPPAGARTNAPASWWREGARRMTGFVLSHGARSCRYCRRFEQRAFTHCPQFPIIVDGLLDWPPEMGGA